LKLGWSFRIFVFSQICLTLTVIFRFLFNVPDFITPFTVFGKQLQYVAYIDLGFFLLGASSAFYLIFDSICKKPLLSLIERIVWGAISFFLAIMIMLLFRWAMMVYYTIFFILIVIVVTSYVMRKNQLTISLQIVKARFKIACLIFIFLILPIIAGASLFNLALNDARSISSEEGKVSFAAEYSCNHTFSVDVTIGVPFFRSNNDMLGFFVFGFSACGELGFLERNILNSIGIKARPVLVPGENHEFNEIFVNGEWMASDPGYKEYPLNTTESRGNGRISEFGAVSLVYAVGEDGAIIWRTDDYNKNIDQVTIQVFRNVTIVKFTKTNNGRYAVEIDNQHLPFANGSIVLYHKFNGSL